MHKIKQNWRPCRLSGKNTPCLSLLIQRYWNLVFVLWAFDASINCIEEMVCRWTALHYWMWPIFVLITRKILQLTSLTQLVLTYDLAWKVLRGSTRPHLPAVVRCRDSQFEMLHSVRSKDRVVMDGAKVATLRRYIYICPAFIRCSTSSICMLCPLTEPVIRRLSLRLFWGFHSTRTRTYDLRQRPSARDFFSL